MVEVTREFGPGYALHLPAPVGFGKPGHVHIVVYRHRLEIVADGQRIAYGPVPLDLENRKLAFGIHAVGVKGQIEKLTYKEARAPSAKGQ